MKWRGLYCIAELLPSSINSFESNAASVQLPVAQFLLDEEQHCIHWLLTMSFLVLGYVLIMFDIHSTLLSSGNELKKYSFI